MGSRWRPHEPPEPHSGSPRLFFFFVCTRPNYYNNNSFYYYYYDLFGEFRDEALWRLHPELRKHHVYLLLPHASNPADLLYALFRFAG